MILYVVKLVLIKIIVNKNCVRVLLIIDSMTVGHLPGIANGVELKIEF